MRIPWDFPPQRCKQCLVTFTLEDLLPQWAEGKPCGYLCRTCVSEAERTGSGVSAPSTRGGDAPPLPTLEAS